MSSLRKQVLGELDRGKNASITPEEYIEGAMALGVSRGQLVELLSEANELESGAEWDGWNTEEFLQIYWINWEAQCALAATRMFRSGSDWDIETEEDLFRAVEKQFGDKRAKSAVLTLPIEWELFVLVHSIKKAVYQSEEISVEDWMASALQPFESVVENEEKCTKAKALMQAATEEGDQLERVLYEQYRMLTCTAREIAELIAGASKENAAESFKRLNYLLRAYHTSRLNAFAEEQKRAMFISPLPGKSVKQEDLPQEAEEQPKVEGQSEEWEEVTEQEEVQKGEDTEEIPADSLSVAEYES